MTYSEMIKNFSDAVIREGRGGRYEEAIDGGTGYMPANTYVVYGDPDSGYSAYYRYHFACYDGWDSDDREIVRGASTYNEALMFCYIDAQECEIADLKGEVVSGQSEIKRLDVLLDISRRQTKALRDKNLEEVS